MTVVHLHHIRTVSAELIQKFGYIVGNSEKHIDTHREIGRPYHRSTAFFKIGNDLFTDISPSCGSDNDRLEVLCEEFIVFPERSRCSEIYAHALLRQRWIGLSHGLAPTCIFYIP